MKTERFPYHEMDNMISLLRTTVAPRLLACLVCLTAPGASQARGWDGTYEYLRDDIRWLFVPAGMAIIHTRPEAEKGVTFETQACTNATVDLLHKVRDRITARSLLIPGGYQSVNFRMKQLESWYSNDMELLFRDNNKVVVKDYRSGRTRSHDVKKGTMDMVTAFFATRLLALEDGGDYKLPVIDRHKKYDLAIDILRRETRKTVLGDETRTIVIQPRLESEGIFERTGNMTIWLTDDERRIPVRMETRIKIGKIISELAEASLGKPEKKDKLLFCKGV